MKIKNYFVFLIMTVILLCSVSSAFAEDSVQFDIEEAGVSLLLPNDMEVITRQTPTDSELFTKHQTTLDNLIDYGIYLQGFSKDDTQVLTVTVSEDANSKNVYNYSLLSEEQIDSIKQSYVNSGNCSSCSVDTYNDIVYFNSIISQKDDSDETVYIEQADTVVNGKYVHFVLQSQNGDIDNADTAFVNSLLENAKFRIIPQTDADKNVLILIWGIVGILVIIILVLIIAMIIRKKRKKTALNRINSRIYNGDRQERLEREERRKNRHTATGAERPDAFFDGVDGFETSQSMDKLERTLLREAHQRYNEQKKNQAVLDDFFENDTKSKKKKSRKKNGSANKNQNNSSRKF